MSRRLRNALLAFHLEQGRPESGTIAEVEHANYRNRHFRRLRKAMGIESTERTAVPGISPHKLTPKDLRDTLASQLLTVGIQLGYVSQQLGHADVSVTAKHYARWAGGNTYRSPLTVGEGEVPADLLSRLQIHPPQSPHSVHMR
jgi:integrase